MIYDNLLSILIALPLIAALIVALLPAVADSKSRWVALGASGVNFLFSLVLLYGFQPTADLQFVIDKQWLPNLGINYFLAVDGISVFLVLLVTLLSPLAILSAWESVKDRVRGFMLAMLVAQAGMIGALVSLDVFLFYIFFELMLIPMFFVIGIWGGVKRIRATVKFMIYTMFGSLFMLLAIVYMGIRHQQETGSWSFAYSDWIGLNWGSLEGSILLCTFILAFGIKAALFPFHTWLPDTYVEAPASATFVLSAIMAKLGIYGLIRFALPIFPDALGTVAPYVLGLAVVGLVYGALICLVQRNAKRMIAYSSFSHLGLILAGVMALNLPALQGSIFHMLSHAMSTGALFLLLGMLYERRGTMEISSFGGLVHSMPRYATVFFIVLLASVGLPPLNGFVGEFLLLLGTFGASQFWGVIAATGIILGAAYMLWLFQRLIFGEAQEENAKLPDLNLREGLIFVPLIALIIGLGVYPQPVMSRIEPSVKHYIGLTARATTPSNVLQSQRSETERLSWKGQNRHE